MRDSSSPPFWMIRMLRSFCPRSIQEEIEGDLIERFCQDERTFGRKKAEWRFLFTVVAFFRPGILMRNSIEINTTDLFMISNYLKVSIRVMSRNKTFTTINIAGLVLGMTGALLLLLWIQHEKSFDKFHAGSDQIYIGWNRATENGQINCWSTTPRILAPTLLKEYAAVEKAVSYAKWGESQLFRKDQTKLIKTTGAFTDAGFLEILSYPLLYGNKKQALANPNSLVLTETFSRQLFGDVNVLGQVVTMSQDGYNFDFVVSGILKDLPSNTHFSFDYLLSFRFLESLGEENSFWGNNSVITLVKLKHGTDIAVFNDQVEDIERNHYADGQHIDIFLFPLTQMRLYSRFENGISTGGRIEVINMLTILAMSLLAIACINFVNLTTARAQRRAREVGVRKVTGAYRWSLIFQFLCESVLTAFIAGIVAALACYFLLPLFNLLVRQEILLSLDDVRVWGWLIAIVLAVGVVAGSYPAFILSSYLPVQF